MNSKPPKPTPNFALDELIGTLEELAKEEENGEGFATTLEVSEKRGWGREKVRKLWDKARKEGRLVVGSKKVQFIDNRMCDITAYKIKPKEEEKGE